MNNDIKSNLMHYAERFTEQNTFVKYMLQIFRLREVAPSRSPAAAAWIPVCLAHSRRVESSFPSRVSERDFPATASISLIPCWRHAGRLGLKQWNVMQDGGLQAVSVDKTAERKCPDIMFGRNGPGLSDSRGQAGCPDLVAVLRAPRKE